jgi:hypothetical protein
MPRKIVTAILIMACALAILPANVSAADPTWAQCNDPKANLTPAQQTTCGAWVAECGSTECPRTSNTKLNAQVKTIINVMLFIVGIASTIMIIYGAIRFVISRGEPEETKKARNTIMYSVVGLVVAILGFAIVNWVIGIF